MKLTNQILRESPSYQEDPRIFYNGYFKEAGEDFYNQAVAQAESTYQEDIAPQLKEDKLDGKIDLPYLHFSQAKATTLDESLNAYLTHFS